MKDTFNVTEQRKILTHAWADRMFFEVNRTGLNVHFDENSRARTTTAYYLTKKGKMLHGRAKGRKGDEYNFIIGAAIASARLMNIPLPWFVAD